MVDRIFPVGKGYGLMAFKKRSKEGPNMVDQQKQRTRRTLLWQAKPRERKEKGRSSLVRRARRRRRICVRSSASIAMRLDIMLLSVLIELRGPVRIMRLHQLRYMGLLLNS